MKKRADMVGSNAASERTSGKDKSRRRSPTHEEIAQLAFCLYESRGRQEGQHLEDWLRAEQELLRR